MKHMQEECLYIQCVCHKNSHSHKRGYSIDSSQESFHIKEKRACYGYILQQTINLNTMNCCFHFLYQIISLYLFVIWLYTKEVESFISNTI